MIRHSHSPLSIGAFASAVGVSVVTVRRWCRAGKVREAVRTPGGHRRFAPKQVRKLLGLAESRSRVGYARVSSHDQKSDLVSQASRLAGVCDGVIEDLGSGLNCKKPGLRRLFDGNFESRSINTVSHAQRPPGALWARAYLPGVPVGGHRWGYFG